MGLVNLISFKKFIHVTEPDLDSMLEDILSGELDTLDGFCNQKLEKEADLVEYHDGERDNIVILRNGNVTDVKSVKIDYDGDGEYEETLTLHDDYEWKAIGEIILKHGYFPEGIKNIEITYTHGFEDTTLPPRLRLAILKQCANTFNASFVLVEKEGDAKVFSTKSITSVFTKYKRHIV